MAFSIIEVTELYEERSGERRLSQNSENPLTVPTTFTGEDHTDVTGDRTDPNTWGTGVTTQSGQAPTQQETFQRVFHVHTTQPETEFDSYLIYDMIYQHPDIPQLGSIVRSGSLGVVCNLVRCEPWADKVNWKVYCTYETVDGSDTSTDTEDEEDEEDTTNEDTVSILTSKKPEVSFGFAPSEVTVYEGIPVGVSFASTSSTGTLQPIWNKAGVPYGALTVPQYDLVVRIRKWEHNPNLSNYAALIGSVNKAAILVGGVTAAPFKAMVKNIECLPELDDNGVRYYGTLIEIQIKPRVNDAWGVVLIEQSTWAKPSAEADAAEPVYAIRDEDGDMVYKCVSQCTADERRDFDIVDQPGVYLNGDGTIMAPPGTTDITPNKTAWLLYTAMDWNALNLPASA